MDLLITSLEPWDEVWRRNQFFVRELVESRPEVRVLFVEPPVDILHELRRGRRPHLGALRPVSDVPRVHAFRPVKVLPRMVGPWADRSLERQLLRVVGRLGMSRPVLWVNDTSYAGLIQRGVLGRAALYDITDDWLLAPVADRQRDRWRSEDEMLMATAREVVVCSPALQTSRGVRREVHLVPNGVDVEHMRRPRPRPVDLPSGPCAVYVGTLHENRLDVELCCRVASDLPEVSFVLVGPDALGPASQARLAAHRNIVVLGARPYGVVPGYLQHADVVVVPHVVSEFTESLDPIKAYECLAVGRPTVSTPVAGFRYLGPPVEVADRGEFPAAVARVLAEPRSGGGATDAPADVPTWRDRARVFGEILDRVATGASGAGAGGD